MIRYTFQYSNTKSATVTVYAKDEGLAIMKARDELDRRYARSGKEPPVAWTLRLKRTIGVEE